MPNIHCPKCNAEVSSLSMACPACGASLANVQSAPLPWTQTFRPAASFGTLFWGVLTTPTSTFEDILAGPRQQHVWKMLLLTAFFESLNNASEKGQYLYVLAFPIGALVSYLVIWIGAWLMSVTGKWLGGTGSVSELYDYAIWAGAPTLFFNFALFMGRLSPIGLWHYGWAVVEFGLAVWAFIISLRLLAAAHRFSMGMAFLNMVIAALVILAVVCIPLLFFGALIRAIWS